MCNFSQKRYECEICHAYLTSPTTLYRHQRFTHWERRSWECSLCERVYNHPESLKRHRRTDHGVFGLEAGSLRLVPAKRKSSKQSALLRPDVYCHLCHRGFFNKSSFNRHMKTHLVDRESFYCDFCQTPFTFICNLKTHVKKFHRSKIIDN
ncbi:uncharacterized protein LOC143234313 [Tachypleus tridentatus]|uniref:uncharacterized protein LOC143234313 n=1 Tax=Tachypleus tridentatus TaxID=6853 RepID=UPI003FD1E578